LFIQVTRFLKDRDDASTRQRFYFPWPSTIACLGLLPLGQFLRTAEDGSLRMVHRELALPSQEYHFIFGDYTETDCWVSIGMFPFIHAFWFIETYARQDF
jgi:hypothetical protein